ncbi:MAG: hypothetical protein ACYDEP_12065 [Acidimicrobiales bacterium]
MDYPSQINPLEYPFDVQINSFVWRAGTIDRLSSFGSFEELVSGRTPVLGIGSNAAPSQLSRKFSEQAFLDGDSMDGFVPVLQALAHDVDVVYAAHLAPYGSLPATAIRSPGVRANVFVTWLTPRQLDRMNETEAIAVRYDFCQIPNVICMGKSLDLAYCYVHRFGAFVHNGHAVGLASSVVDGSTIPRMSEPDILELVAKDSGASGNGPALARSLVDDAAISDRINTFLEERSIPPDLRPVTLLSVGGGTENRHHRTRSRPYVMAVSPATVERLRLNTRATVASITGQRSISTIATLVVDENLSEGTVLLDQTLRNALGLLRTGDILGHVSVQPLKLTVGQQGGQLLGLPLSKPLWSG